LRLWDVSSGKEVPLFEGRAAGHVPIAFSPDGRVLASVNGSPQSDVEAVDFLWDMPTGKELCRHGGHGFEVVAAAFSPDGKWVVSGGTDDRDSSVHVWEAATGRLIRRFEGHHSWVWAVTFAADARTVASAAGDSTILLWDVTGRQQGGKLRPATLTPRQLDACWAALAGDDTSRAYDAVWLLVAAPGQTLPFLQQHLSAVPRAEGERVSRLLEELDSDQFPVRERAMKELAKLGETATPALQQALASKPPLEMRRRLGQLLDQSRQWRGDRLRDHRAIQVLEHIGTRQAQEVLQKLAAGAEGAYRTEAAREALQRLRR
jgi:hypothetical protein